ncbi:MAG: hypothetical protein IJ486_08635 [Firmicutes bacterium]|nr:hypothetical protein [Bacillota bacterium]
MKKKYVSIFMILCLLMMTLVGCGGSGTDEDLDQNMGDMEELYFTIDAYWMSNGMLYGEYASGEVLETQSWGMAALPGQTVGEALEALEITSLEAKSEDDVFEGWMIFKDVITVDEDGFEEYSYELISEGTIYSTEELMELEVPAEPVTYVAKWENILIEDYFAEDESEGGYGYESSDVGFSLGANGGVMIFRSSEGDLMDSGMYTYWYSAGKSLDEAVADDGWDALDSIEKDGAVFAGWSVYYGDSMEWGSVEDVEEGYTAYPFDSTYEGFEYIVLENAQEYGTGLTTDEVFSLVNEGYYYYALAEWE